MQSETLNAVTTTPRKKYVVGPPIPAAISATSENALRGDQAHEHKIIYTSEGDPASILGTNERGGISLPWLAVNRSAQQDGERSLDWRFLIDGRIGVGGDQGGIGNVDGGDVKLYSDLVPDLPYARDLGSARKKFGAIYAGALVIETLVKQEVKADVGGRIITGVTDSLTRPLSTASFAEIIHCEYGQMVNGDVLWFEGDGQFEMMRVTSNPVQYAGSDDYVVYVERAVEGVKSAWDEGAAFINTGGHYDPDNSGQIAKVGFIDQYARQSVRSKGGGVTDVQGPTVTGFVRYGYQPLEFDVRWAIGNLNDLYGYTTDIYGVGLGDYAQALGNWLTIENNNGMRFYSDGDRVLNIHPSRGVQLVSDGVGGIKRRLSYVGTDGVEYAWIGAMVASQQTRLNMQIEPRSGRDSGIYIQSRAYNNYDSVLELSVNRSSIDRAGIFMGSQPGSKPYIILNARLADDGVGEILLLNLPTSSTGLTTGALWNSSGTVKIKT